VTQEQKNFLKSEWWNPIWRAPKVWMILLCKNLIWKNFEIALLLSYSPFLSPKIE